jgi:hypothetical protein
LSPLLVAMIVCKVCFLSVFCKKKKAEAAAALQAQIATGVAAVLAAALSTAPLHMWLLTLFYSSEGSPALAVFRPHYLQIDLTIPGFSHNCLPVSCVEIGFFKKSLVLAWKSGLKVSLLPLGRSCPFQAILLRDLVGCDSPLQIVMAILHTIIVSKGLSHPT